MDRTQLGQAIDELLESYEAQRAEESRQAFARIQSLEAEVVRLTDQLQEYDGIAFQVTDEALRRRLQDLGSAPFDTQIREAGVVLEDRIRKLVGPSGVGQTGAKLIDLAFTPNAGQFQVSPIAAEQTGIQNLYRGAVLFIRNPPMHRLIEYPQQTAYIMLQLIDSLLLLLEEVTATDDEQVDEKTPGRWTVSRLRTAIVAEKNRKLAGRFGDILEWTVSNRKFLMSTSKNPLFGIKGQNGQRVLGVSLEAAGWQYFVLTPDVHENEETRRRLFEAYQDLGFIEAHEDIADIKEGRESRRPLADLTDEEFAHYFQLLQEYFG